MPGAEQVRHPPERLGSGILLIHLHLAFFRGVFLCVNILYGSFFVYKVHRHGNVPPRTAIRHHTRIRHDRPQNRSIRGHISRKIPLHATSHLSVRIEGDARRDRRMTGPCDFDLRVSDGERFGLEGLGGRGRRLAARRSIGAGFLLPLLPREEFFSPQPVDVRSNFLGPPDRPHHRYDRLAPSPVLLQVGTVPLKGVPEPFAPGEDGPERVRY
mmetsp:Transcript_36393/g.67264  ORF Transcript_36393/g.67264 Transcript_36393/m.67264 type:complete len:213 (-) Transcript_36393:171-809(-)